MAPKQVAKPAPTFSLPVSVVSRVDAARLSRELESLGDFFEQQEHNQNKTAAPLLTRTLQDAAQTNSLDLAQAADRTHLKQFLKDVKATAPMIHMSFAAEPPSAFTAKIVSWLRTEVNPLLLLEVGLQPTIAAGCIIRTTNKYFDCSVRQHLLENKPKLVDMLRGTKHV